MTKRKKIFLTGASSGIGRALASRLVADQYDLVLAGRNLEKLQQVRRELETRDGQIELLSFDLRDVDSLKRARTENPQAFLDIDILINNAGLGLGWGALPKADLQEMLQVLAANVSGLVELTRLVTTDMIQRRTGLILNVGSVAGHWASFGNAAYSSSKFTVAALTETWRSELEPFNILTMCIEPGLVNTSMAAPAMLKDMRPLQPDEVAQAILWCLSGPENLVVENMVLFPTDQYSVDWVARKNRDN